MSIKDYFVKICGITEERFDEFAEYACRIKEDGAPIRKVCKGLSDSELFELFASYGKANRERRKVDEP